jgi:hypothetical protein
MLAALEGMSFEHFVALAVAEKLSALESVELLRREVAGAKREDSSATSRLYHMPNLSKPIAFRNSSDSARQCAQVYDHAVRAVNGR